MASFAQSTSKTISVPNKAGMAIVSIAKTTNSTNIADRVTKTTETTKTTRFTQTREMTATRRTTQTKTTSTEMTKTAPPGSSAERTDTTQAIKTKRITNKVIDANTTKDSKTLGVSTTSTTKQPVNQAKQTVAATSVKAEITTKREVSSRAVSIIPADRSTQAAGTSTRAQLTTTAEMVSKSRTHSWTTSNFSKNKDTAEMISKSTVTSCTTRTSNIDKSQDTRVTTGATKADSPPEWKDLTTIGLSVTLPILAIALVLVYVLVFRKRVCQAAQHGREESSLECQSQSVDFETDRKTDLATTVELGVVNTVSTPGVRGSKTSLGFTPTVRDSFGGGDQNRDESLFAFRPLSYLYRQMPPQSPT